MTDLGNIKKPTQNTQRSRGTAKSSGITTASATLVAAAVSVMQSIEAETSTAIALKDMAMEFYQSDFDVRLLPPDETLKSVVQKIAEKIQLEERRRFGQFYVDPGVIDVTSIPVISESSGQAMALSFFGDNAQPRQIAGGN